MPELPGSKTRVDGVAAVGDTVTYEDMANPRRSYVVELLPHPAGRSPSAGILWNPTDYVLADVETGALIYSDLRQYGWTRT